MSNQNNYGAETGRFFSQKASFVLVTCSAIVLFLGTVIILNSNQFVQGLYNFLSQDVFHREFDMKKWMPTMESIFLIPLFLVVTVNAILFPKYCVKYKMAMLCILLVDMLVAIVYTTAVTTDAHVNSDLAAEYLLAKQCFLEKSILPLGWHYSTEIYILGKHLISAPMFFFTENLGLIKTMTTLLCTLVLLGSCWYLLSKLDIKQLWVKLLVCIMVISPFSGLVWYVLAWGTFYIPHVVFSFVYLGLFLELMRQSNAGNVKKITLGAFLTIGFLCGLSTIRYIMNFQFPLALALILSKAFKKGADVADVKRFWLEERSVFYSVVGLVAGGFGYLFNNIVLQSLYSFREWNTIAFCELGTVTFLDIFRSVLQTVGFLEGVSVFTPSGIINLLIYIALLVLILFLLKASKVDIPRNQKILILFFFSSFLFNTFVYLNIEFIFRYMVNILIFIVPCIAVLLSSDAISSYKKYGLGVVWSIVLFVSAFTTMQSNLNGDSNISKYPVRDFLLSQDYEFGYGTFWNANVFTYLTNGKIEMGNLDSQDNEDGVAVISKEYGYYDWLTPKRYYSNDYGDKPIFLILSQEEYKAAEENSTLQVGKEVYSDEFYRVFEYPSHQAFRESFAGNDS